VRYVAPRAAPHGNASRTRVSWLCCRRLVHSFRYYNIKAIVHAVVLIYYARVSQRKSYSTGLLSVCPIYFANAISARSLSDSTVAALSKRYGQRTLQSFCRKADICLAHLAHCSIKLVTKDSLSRQKNESHAFLLQLHDGVFN